MTDDQKLTTGLPASGQVKTAGRSVLGLDIGGTGIKAAVVDPDTGTLLSARYRVPTPHPAVPDAVANVVAEMVQHFDWSGPIGCTFPAVVKDGVVYSAANVDPSWIGTDAQLTVSSQGRVSGRAFKRCGCRRDG